jgi:hypothetical protein
MGNRPGSIQADALTLDAALIERIENTVWDIVAEPTNPQATISAAGVSVSASRGDACSASSHPSRQVLRDEKEAPCAADSYEVKFKPTTESSWKDALSVPLVADGDDKLKATIPFAKLGNDPNTVWEFTAEADKHGKPLLPLPAQGDEGIPVVMATKDYTLPSDILATEDTSNAGNVNATWERSQAAPGASPVTGYRVFIGQGEEVKSVDVAHPLSANPTVTLTPKDGLKAGWSWITVLPIAGAKVIGAAADGNPRPGNQSNIKVFVHVGPWPEPTPDINVPAVMTPILYLLQ